MRTLGWFALAIVIIQGIIGGKRVLFDAMSVPGFEMSFGQMLRIPHGILAQLYVCILIFIVAGLSRPWIERRIPVSHATRRIGAISIGLLLLQLTIAATMRHNYAGLAIPTFPASTPDGNWLPPTWDYRVMLNFAHRVMAIVLSVSLVWFAIKLWTDCGASLLMRCGASLMIGLLGFQILLGAHVIWQFREPHVTTGHVVCGAFLLATTFWLTCLVYRDVIEAKTSSP
jgi:cytochrome c oxidase assembly protein subunit 15